MAIINDINRPKDYKIDKLNSEKYQNCILKIENVDVIQVGARNMQNFKLLKAVLPGVVHA